jgi:hypothetical protein
MGFFSGRVSFLRFKVNGAAPRLFDQEHLDRLADRQAGRQRIASADGIETGWTAGDHVLDTDFTLAKNIINDTLTSTCGWTPTSSPPTCCAPTTPSS